jgi:glyoxylase-like metal-dependent hydrolase (beta-lactamase superfamily II)
MTQHYQIGDVRVSRIEELMGPMFDPVRFFPSFDPSLFDQHASWLYPNHAERESGRIVASMHSWLIDTGTTKILVDTCLGNHKDRQPYRDWDHLDTPWLSRLHAAGARPEDIDYVLCTHLHVDHVGWNTQLKDGSWIPTFPNARYLFCQAELDHLVAELADLEEEDTFGQVNAKTFEDSIKPILSQAELIDHDQALADTGAELMLTPGHTPGSMSLRLSCTDKPVYFTGDVCHHPLQMLVPEMNSAYCQQPDVAIATRRSLLSRCEQEGALLLPAHFGPPHGCQVREEEASFIPLWKAMDRAN